VETHKLGTTSGLPHIRKEENVGQQTLLQILCKNDTDMSGRKKMDVL
jgi:hypothetical protein